MTAWECAPSLRQQEKAILKQADCLYRSYRELDGKVHDPALANEIACLTAAAETIRNIRSHFISSRRKHSAHLR